VRRRLDIDEPRIGDRRRKPLPLKKDRPDRDAYVAEWVERARQMAIEQGLAFDLKRETKRGRQSYQGQFLKRRFGGQVASARRGRRERAAVAIERRALLLAEYTKGTP
jgi:hypothetical protein